MSTLLHRSRCLVLILAGLLYAPWAVAATARSAQIVLPPTEFDILSTDSGQLIGRGHYSAIHNADGIDLRGDSRYLDGSYDIEQDRLSIYDGKPVLEEFRHTFFYKGGAPQAEAHLVASTGLGSCITYQGTNQTRDDKTLDFSRDTYAGVTVLLPIQDFLRNRSNGAILKMHVFNCAPGPKLIPVEVKPEPKTIRWMHYPAMPLEEIEVKPDFGLWNFVILPFVPKLAAWFDPAEDWAIVGAQLQRYYRGPNIIMVRHDAGAPSAAAAQATNPSVAGVPPP